jgi:hypothetical protein
MIQKEERIIAEEDFYSYVNKVKGKKKSVPEARFYIVDPY